MRKKKRPIEEHADNITPHMFGLLRFLVICARDDSDEEGWIDFEKKRLACKINMDDRSWMGDMEEMGLLVNRRSGFCPSIRITPEGWEMVAYISSIRHRHDPGWRIRKEPLQ